MSTLAVVVHLHAAMGAVDDPSCACVCGVPCGTRATTAYRSLDPERVTCPACLAGNRVRRGVTA